MANQAFLTARKQYSRPQAMIWSDTPPILESGSFVPSGYDKMIDQRPLSEAQRANGFLILSDHNRSEININSERIEQRKRMVNGTMRSHHNADKLTISTSWTMLPSRSFSSYPDINPTTGLPNFSPEQYIVDSAADGGEMLEWYENHVGPFWVLLSYDKYKNFSGNAYVNLNKYSQTLEMYLTNFNYSVVKRGGNNHDLWNISITLEEV